MNNTERKSSSDSFQSELSAGNINIYDIPMFLTTMSSMHGTSADRRGPSTTQIEQICSNTADDTINTPLRTGYSLLFTDFRHTSLNSRIEGANDGKNPHFFFRKNTSSERPADSIG